MIVIGNSFPKLQIVKDLVKPLNRKRSIGTFFDSQRVDGCQTHVKYAWEHIYHIFWSLSGEMTWKMCPFLKIEILEVFVTTLNADHK